jgi:hypothetical protein
MRKLNKPALKEALTDTALGAMINVPLNLVLLWWADIVNMSILSTGILLSVVFTIIAIVRKYMLRSFFEKKSCHHDD